MPIVDVVMYGKKFHGGDFQRLQVPSHRVSSQRRVGSTQRFGDFRMKLRESFDVQFVDHRLVERRARRLVVTPGKGGIHDSGQWCRRRVVPLIKRQIFQGVANAVAE